MQHSPIVVHHIDWDIILKCKNGEYATKEDCLKSIWTEEYANPIERYNTYGMIHIMGQVIERVVPIEKRAYLLDSILRDYCSKTHESLLDRLYLYLMNLDVRKRDCFCDDYDLYIIEYNDKYYTIAQYDELKAKET